MSTPSENVYGGRCNKSTGVWPLTQNDRRKKIYGLGIVSLFNDLSSEVIIRVLPLYLLFVVQSSVFGLSIVEAVADGTAVLSRLFSGAYSDKLKKRKPLILFGYGLSVFSRFFIVLSSTVFHIAGLRFLDRLGKGIRTPARDALIADLSHGHERGVHFGINRALDTLGAVIGLVATVVFINASGFSEKESLKYIILLASVVGLLALFVLWFMVHEEPKESSKSAKKISFRWSELNQSMKTYLPIAFLFSLASSSDAFIVVRAKELKLSLIEILWLLVLFNIVNGVAAYYFSRLSDRLGRFKPLFWGWSIYSIVYILFSLPTLTPFYFAFLVMGYGLFYGLTESVEKALVADFETDGRRGHSYGWLGLVSGIGVILANLIFGLLYQNLGMTLAFLSSAGFALAGILFLAIFKDRMRSLKT